jgi:zinc/manganese transport system ATP-binding protein
MSTAAITLSHLHLAWRQQPAVRDLSGSFAAGSLTAVVGPNGGGKTSLMAALTGQLAPQQGRVQMAPMVQGRMAYLPQVSQIDRSFPVRVLDVVMLGHWGRQGAWRAATRARSEQARQALATVGLAGLEGRSLAELSTGQFQRVLFARLLLQDAPLILLDEPFAAVDAHTTYDLLSVIRRWHDEARTVIAVLHDLEAVRRFFPQTLLLAREPVAWGPTVEVLTPGHLQRARRLSERWDGRQPWAADLLAAA